MKDRILQIMKSASLSNAEFAEKIGISTSSLSHIFSGRNNPSLDVVMRIHKSYPTININWLLYGEGEMTQERSVVSDTTTDSVQINEPMQITGFGVFENSSENREIPANGQVASEFCKDNASETTENGGKITEREVIKYIEKPQPKITEIRIFFDNGTYQVFKPDM